MSLIKTLKRLEYANFLIKKKVTGNLAEFAKKMGVSKRTVSELITQMREMGATILYDRNRETYYYAEHGEFSISKFVNYGQVMTREDPSLIGNPEELCFSEKAIFVPCNK